MAPLPTLFALLCCIAALVVRCDGLECKKKNEDKDGKELQSGNNATCKTDFVCSKATCTGGEDNNKNTALLWGCSRTDKDRQKICEVSATKAVKGFAIAIYNAPDSWTCTCTFYGGKSNAARLSVKTLMAMPPLLLGIVVPIVRANLLRSY